MADRSDYFVNHMRTRQFPWSLYHDALERDLADFLVGIADRKPDASVLVVGCGLWNESDRVPSTLRYTIADVDPRALDAVLARRDPRVVGSLRVEPEAPLDRTGQTFDAVYAKEVVEHVLDWPTWLVGLRRSLAPGGQAWLSTPNYGEPWLPALERTALEAVARLSGYTRRGMHPSPFSRASLRAALRAAGFERVEVRTSSWRLALVARATRPAADG